MPDVPWHHGSQHPIIWICISFPYVPPFFFYRPFVHHLYDYSHIDLNQLIYTGNSRARKTNKAQTKQENITGIQYLRAYHQVASNSSFILYPIFILLPQYLLQLPFLPPPPPPPPSLPEYHLYLRKWPYYLNISVHFWDRLDMSARILDVKYLYFWSKMSALFLHLTY